MQFSLAMTATPHRSWYIDGDVVKVRVGLTCVPEMAQDTRKELIPLPGVQQHNHFSIDSSEADSGETDVRVGPLEVELRGLVEVDLSVMKPIRWPAAAGDRKIQMSPPSRGSPSVEVYTLYSTGRKHLREWMQLKRNESVAIEFVFRLPEGCPPTFKGRAADYRHDITISATWFTARSAYSAKAAAPHTCALEIPLIVFNTVASVAQLPLMSLFPLRPDSALVAEGFHFQATSLAAVPEPSMAAPLTDVMRPQDAQLRTSLTVRHDAKAMMQSCLAAQRQPLSLMMPCRGVNVLQIHLRSSCISLGDYLQGMLTVIEPSQGLQDTIDDLQAQRKQHQETPVPVSVTLSLELLECCTQEFALAMQDDSVVDTRVHGFDKFICANRRVVHQSEFCVLDTPCVPFEFSLPVGFLPTTTITDITTFLWQLRAVVTVVPRKALALTAKPGVDRLGPLLEPVAGVFPLLVVPPSVPCKVRQGAAW